MDKTTDDKTADLKSPDFCLLLSGNVKEGGMKEDNKEDDRQKNRQEMKEDKRKLQDIELDKIIVSKANPRKKDPEKDINILIDSLKRYGLMTPIEVRKIGDLNLYEVTQGQRRVIAARRLGWTKIRGWVLPDSGDSGDGGSDNSGSIESLILPEDDLERSFREQIDRSDLDPVDRGRAVKELLEKYGRDWLKLSEIMNRPVATLKNWAEFGNVPDEMQKLVADKKIGEGYVRKIARYSDMDGDELVKIAKTVADVEDKSTRDAIISHIKRQPKVTAEDIDKKFIMHEDRDGDRDGEGEEKELVVNMIFSSRISKAIKEESEKRCEEPHHFIKTITREYLEEKGYLKD